jgi:hypothetical protein
MLRVRTSVIDPDGIAGQLRAGLTNLVAVIGVATLGWSAGALLVVYWVEAGVALVRGILQGPFAKREPEDGTPEQRRVKDRYMPLSSWDDKRSGVSIGLLPPVYPRNMSGVLSSTIVMLIVAVSRSTTTVPAPRRGS